MAKPSVKEQLLEAGTKILHAQGFNGCGVQDLTEAAGVPKGSFYNHFDSKEAFGAAVVERAWQGGAGSRDLLSDASVPPLERLERHFDAMTAGIVASGFRGCLMGNLGAELADQSPLIRDRLSAIFAAWSRSIENCIREAQRAGDARADRDPAVLAAFVINAWEGAGLRAKLDKDAAAFTQFKAIVFPGLFR